jgi:hypothetical protein
MGGLLMVLFFLANFVNAQSNCDFAGVEGLVISEVSAEGRIEIYNGSDSDLDLAEYYLYTSPAYRQIEDLALDCGATLLAPGATLAVSPLAGFDAIDGEVALYTDSNFEDPGSIISYLEYGSAGHKRAPVAVAAGIWDVNDFVAPPTATASINAVLDEAGELDFASLAPSICTPNISITNHQVEVDGGAIALADGNLSTSICVDGNADPLEVVRDGNGTGPNRDFVITDNTGLILALPEGNGPFDLDGAGVGTCEIWYLAYADGLEGKVVGNNLFSDLEGCYDLSNPITVIREAADGGAVTLANGGTNFIGCAGDIVFDVTHTTTAPNLSYWYIITDDNNDILGFANSANTNTLDLSGAPAGTCRIWGWSYRGLPDPVVGEPLSSIAPDGSCADISDDFITVYREIPDGGTITTAGGASDTTVVAGDAFVTVAHTTTAQFLSYWYIITDDNGSILGFQNSTAGNTLDLSGAPVGTCRIWGWSYRGLDDPIIGEDIATLNDDFCETISTGFVTVNRIAEDCDIVTNDITFADGTSTTTSICVDGNADPLDVIRNGGSGNNDATGWIITDAATGVILGVPASPPFDLDGAGEGTCEIWYVRYLTDGFSGLEAGNLLSDLEGCFDLSNPLQVIREIPDGGTVTLANGGTNFIGCAGDIVFDVTHTTTAPNLSYWYIITDDNNDILGFANSANTNTLDLSGAPAGTCRIWGWSYRGLPDPVVGEPLSSIAPDGSCADISDDFITVYREIPDGGTITTAGGASDTTVVAGDAFVTVAHTTTAQFLSYWYIITDDNGSILGFQNSTAGNTLDLSGAPVGTCRIWGWSYRGLDDPIIGEDIATLNDDFCETISTGFVTVIREGDDNGFEFDDVIINEVSNDGQVEIFNGTDEAIDVSNYWLCNFPTYTRLSNLTLECGSLMIQPGEYTVVSGFSAFNATDAELGLYRTNSFSSANAIVSYLEWGSSGHQRAGVAISAGIWTADFAVPAPTAAESIQTFTESGSLSWSLETPTLCENNNNTTSTNLLDNGVEINIYPNPTSDYINVELQGLTSPAVDMQVFNQAGQLVSDLHLDSGNGLNSLDLTNLPAGTYLLRVVSGNASTSHLISRF